MEFFNYRNLFLLFCIAISVHAMETNHNRRIATNVAAPVCVPQEFPKRF